MNMIKVQPKFIDAAKPLSAQLDILR